jgi:hypothetical protein
MTTTTDNDESGMVVVVIAKLDAVHNTETKERFGVTGFPTLLYFADEKVYKYQPRTVQALKEFVLEGYTCPSREPRFLRRQVTSRNNGKSVSPIRGTESKFENAG